MFQIHIYIIKTDPRRDRDLNPGHMVELWEWKGVGLK